MEDGVGEASPEETTKGETLIIGFCTDASFSNETPDDCAVELAVDDDDDDDDDLMDEVEADVDAGAEVDVAVVRI